MTSQENIVHTTPAEAPPPLQIGIFFDGTGNGDEIKNKNKWSNVKYLYDMHQGDDELFDNKNYIKRKFYQRGVGSHEDDSDFYIDFESAMGAGAEKRFENVVFNIENIH
jgi:hypothetical protein